MKTFGLVVVAMVAVACGEPVEHSGAEGVAVADQSLGLSGARAAAVLEVANRADLHTLDNGVGLDARAAYHIVQVRDSDGEFVTVAQLDAVPYVGPQALERMARWADQQGLVGCPGCVFTSVEQPTAGRVLGVEENSYVALGILAAANDASRDELDADAGLDGRAADAIIAERQRGGAFHSLARLAAVPYVGQRAFDRLRSFAAAEGLEPFCGDGLVQGPEVCDGTPGCDGLCLSVK